MSQLCDTTPDDRLCSTTAELWNESARSLRSSLRCVRHVDEREEHEGGEVAGAREVSVVAAGK